MHDSAIPLAPGFGPLVSVCARYGIGRTLGFELARKGIIETFHVGGKRMVVIASLESLPERLRSAQQAEK